MEYLTRFKLISLPALIIENMYKVIHRKNRKHGMPYEYLLKRLFDNFRIFYENRIPGSVK